MSPDTDTAVRAPGIDEDERDALFEPFYRSKRTSLVSGMGIGLSVCARLVEASGGRIWCANREGGGCEFGFALPAVVEDELFEVAEEPALAEAATT